MAIQESRLRGRVVAQKTLTKVQRNGVESGVSRRLHCARMTDGGEGARQEKKLGVLQKP